MDWGLSHEEGETMKVLIFGSTGSIGLEVVQQALEQGHTVTAFARNPAKLNLKHENLKVVQGDVLNLAVVEQAVQGQDAVLCVLGSGGKRKGTIRSEGTQQIIRAMEKAGVRRFICQTTLGIGDSQGNLDFFWKYIMFGLLLREVHRSCHSRELCETKQPELDYRPAWSFHRWRSQGALSTRVSRHR
jgi:nucleoside-diphosphate-sugar epimerase